MSNIRTQTPLAAEPAIAPNPEDLAATDPAAHINQLQSSGSNGGPGGLEGYGPTKDYNHQGPIINSQGPDHAAVVPGVNADGTGATVVPEPEASEDGDKAENAKAAKEQAEKAKEEADKDKEDEDKKEHKKADHKKVEHKTEHKHK